MKTCEHKYEVKWVTAEAAVRAAHQALLTEKPTLAFSILNKFVEQANAQAETENATRFERGETKCVQCPEEVIPGVQVVDGTKK